MNKPEFERLIETARVRPLTPEEFAQARAWLLTHPGAQFEWEQEQQINDALRALPDVPVSSNFTARVLAAVERDLQAETRQNAPPWWRRWRLAPRFAATAVCAAALGISLWQYREREHRRVAESLRAMAGVACVPSVDVDVLRDFEVIHRLSQLPPTGDDELVRALQ